MSGNVVINAIWNKLPVIAKAGIPTISPQFVGQRYYDTANEWSYVCLQLSNPPVISDWHLIYAYGIQTVTAGGGDVTINFGGNWKRGSLEVFTSIDTDYMDTNLDSHFLHKTTWAALTVAAYLDGHVLSEYIRSNTTTLNQNNFTNNIKSANIAGMPKSVTETTLTLNDNGATTTFCKYIIKA